MRRAERRALADVPREHMRASSAEPVHRLSHERHAETNAPPDLCGKFFESFEPKSACRALLRLWQRRRDGEVISRVQCDCLIDDFEGVLELLELTTHVVEAAQQRGVVNGLGAGIEKTIEGGFQDSRLVRAGALGGRFQMIGDRPVTIKVTGEGGSATSRQAESLGLIATELVMNALKHAFPTNKIDGRIIIAYDVDGTNWKLSVADNGIGKPDGVFAQPKTGLGTGIVKALAQQLDATVETSARPEGTTVSITHATFSMKAIRAA